jgi:uncharacterized membrane protein
MKMENEEKSTKSTRIGFFEEDVNVFSVTRLIFAVGILWSIVFTTAYSFKEGVTASDLALIFGSFSGVFSALKIGNKIFEK